MTKGSKDDAMQAVPAEPARAEGAVETSGVVQPVTDAHYTAIGKVAVEWSWLEAAIEVSIWRLLETSGQAGPAVTTHIAPRVRLDIITALVSLRTNKVQQEAFVSLVNQIKEAGLRRNSVIHGFWLGVYHKEEGEPARLPRVTARGKVARRDTKVVAKDVEELSNHIFRLTRELLFLMDFYVSLPIRDPYPEELNPH
jgi:hypothetical protein